MKLTKLILLTLVLQGCATNQSQHNNAVGSSNDVSVSIDNMSIALKTLYLAGFSEGISDTQANTGSTNPSIINSAGTLAYFTGDLASLGGPSFSFSGSQMGWLSLTQGLRGNVRPTDKLDRMIMAYIPKSLAKTQGEAKLLLAKSVAEALARMDSQKGVKPETFDETVDFAPEITMQHMVFQTDRNLFVNGVEGVSQGTMKHGRPVRAAYFNHYIVKSVEKSPISELDSWIVTTKIALTPYTEMSKDDIALEYVELAKQLPEWCFIFKLLNNVPVILNQEKAHLFIKPTDQKGAHIAPVSPL
jgi:hypothetical protein